MPYDYHANNYADYLINCFFNKITVTNGTAPQ